MPLSLHHQSDSHQAPLTLSISVTSKAASVEGEKWSHVDVGTEDDTCGGKDVAAGIPMYSDESECMQPYAQVLHLSTSLLTTSSTSISKNTWLADTGANAHVVNDMRWFTDFVPMNMNIGTANDATSMRIRGGGTVAIQLVDLEGDICEVTLSDVAYAPDARCNLLSR